MRRRGGPGDVVARRPLSLAGVLFVVAAIAHVWWWTVTPGPGRTFSTALGSGQYVAAASALATYPTAHPAYVAAAIVGVALVVRDAT